MVRCVYFTSMLENLAVRFQDNWGCEVTVQIQSDRDHKYLPVFLQPSHAALLKCPPLSQSTFLKQDPLPLGAVKVAIGGGMCQLMESGLCPGVALAFLLGAGTQINATMWAYLHSMVTKLNHLCR